MQRQSRSRTQRLALLLSWTILAVTAASAAPANWTEHRDPNGFVVRHPPGWIVETPEKDLVVIHDSTGGIQAIAYGFMTRAEVTPAQWLQQIPARFQNRFQKVRMEPVQQKRGGQAVVGFRYASRWGDGRATVLCWLNRGAGMMFAMAAPVFRYDQSSGDLYEILRSFTITQPQGGSRPPQNTAARPAPNPMAGIQWTSWQDPVENAFSMEVPRGWRVEGGTVRRGSVDVHGYLRMTSPEGILVFVSDRDMTSFVVPDQTLAISGFPEGSRYSPGYGTQMVVMRYQPGVVFAEQWARRVGGGSIQVRDRKSREDLAARANAINRQAGGGYAQINTTYGEVSFAGANGQTGYVLAGTQLTQVAGTAMWVVDTLVGCTAPPARMQTAMGVIAHLMQTFRVNPQWFAAQQQTTAQTSRIVTETNNYVSQVITESYWNRQAAQDRTNQNFSDYIRGVQVVVDPNTGQKYEAVAGHNYYYLPPGSTTTVASDTQAPPNIDLIELQPTRR